MACELQLYIESNMEFYCCELYGLYISKCRNAENIFGYFIE